MSNLGPEKQGKRRPVYSIAVHEAFVRQESGDV
jgi:hypothetical protein